MDPTENKTAEEYPEYRETPKVPFRWKRLLAKAGIIALLIGIGLLWFHLRTLSIRKKMRDRIAVVDKQIEIFESKVFYRADRPGLIDGNSATAYNALMTKLTNTLDFSLWRNWQCQRVENMKWEDIDAFLDNASKILMPEMRRIQNMKTIHWSPGYRNFVFGNFKIQLHRRLAQLTRGLRNRAGERGNSKEAAELTLMLFQLGADFQQVDWLIADLVGIGMVCMAFNMDKTDFGAWELSQSDWKNISDRLDIIRPEFGEFSDSLKCELACGEYFIGNTSLTEGLWLISFKDSFYEDKFLPYTQSDIWDNLQVLVGTYEKAIALIESEPTLEEALRFQKEEEKFAEDATCYRDRQLSRMIMPHYCPVVWF